jgi:hypothetical protein
MVARFPDRKNCRSPRMWKWRAAHVAMVPESVQKMVDLDGVPDPP